MRLAVIVMALAVVTLLALLSVDTTRLPHAIVLPSTTTKPSKPESVENRRQIRWFSASSPLVFGRRTR
jgi:hypothetical protein